MKLSTLILAFASGLLLPPSLLASGGPFAVDDAEIVDRCQIESGWLRRDGNASLGYFAPSCTLADIEWTLRLSRLREDGEAGNAAGLQTKLVLREADLLPGLALAAGVEGGTSSWRAESLYAYLALSHDLAEFLRLNANLGHARERVARLSSTTYGIGFDWRLGERLHLIGERFGDDRGSRPGSQLGLRGILDPDRLHLDLVLGRNLEDLAGTWFGAGLVFEF